MDEAIYVSGPHHKRFPADYKFQVNPRPNKSLCDSGRIVKRDEAKRLFREGVKRGMIGRLGGDGFPKYVWAVDDFEGRVYEAKLGQVGANDDAMRRRVVKEWKTRWPMR